MNVMKVNNNVSIRKQISVDLSASDWKLQTNKFSRLIIEKVANLLNRRLVLSFNTGKSQKDVKTEMTSLMNDFALYGATSKDTQKVLSDLLVSLFIMKKV